MTMLPDRYAYRVFWSEPDDCFVATVAEWPTLSWAADTPAEALTGLIEVVRDALANLEPGEAAPEPFMDRHYSGKMTLRVPPLIHRNLVIEAAEQGVSINRLAAAKLAA
ncbi:MAG: type II toxin-antitoxin system HicB family antitoxin [Propionibacteriaceae bacterium]|jgi:predicted RNase H-like HicB family nuclease|nr:type II toxin-antitoxin system HicB family antitoxin [Propionibacteriaceae bacterium]